MRRLPPIIYAIVFFDALLMFALVPLLPDYVDQLGLTKTQAGAVIGIYSAATLVMALPAGRIADRFGPRRITIAGRGADDRLHAGLRVRRQLRRAARRPRRPGRRLGHLVDGRTGLAVGGDTRRSAAAARWAWR